MRAMTTYTNYFTLPGLAEHMLMQAAVLEILFRTTEKILPTAARRIHFVIMECSDFR